MSFEIFDEINEILVAGNTIPGGIIDLCTTLCSARSQMNGAEWKGFVKRAREHPLCALLHKDPLTLRAFMQPRGYQGDAELLDLIYSKNPLSIGMDAPTGLGEKLFAHTIECGAPVAVRNRRKLLVTKMKEIGASTNRPDVLSVACGHMREIADILTELPSVLGTVVGLDQDERSLEVVRHELGNHGVEAIKGSVRQLLSGPLTTRRFDFIYSAGLFDYLEDRLCQALAASLFRMLKPGGTLLLANYLAGTPDVAYMEIYMDWWLRYRSSAEIRGFQKEIPAALIAKTSFRIDPTNQVGYLELLRA